MEKSIPVLKKTRRVDKTSIGSNPDPDPDSYKTFLLSAASSSSSIKPESFHQPSLKTMDYGMGWKGNNNVNNTNRRTMPVRSVPTLPSATVPTRRNQ